MARKTSTERWMQYRGLLHGVKKRWLARPPMMILGKTYAPPEITGELQSLLDEFAETKRLHDAWRAQVAKQRRHERRMRGFVHSIGRKVRAEAGRDAGYLGDFALEPEKKPGPKSVEVKARSAEKARATRARRAPSGKRRRA